MKLQMIETLTEKQLIDLQYLYKYVMGRERSIEDLKVMIKNCVVIAICEHETDQLIGFCRVITDGIYRAVIYDVMADSSYQGKGVGRMLMDKVLEHPLIKSVERIELYTLDKVSFYEKWGFKVNNTMTIMRRTKV